MAQTEVNRPIGGNSSLRKIGDTLMNKPTEWLVKKFPGITADRVTYAGLGLTLAGSALKAVPERAISSGNPSLVALGLMATGAILDGLDGQVARARGESSLKGALTDVLSDRIGESGMALSRIIQAASRKDLWGVVAATVAGVTGPLPSLMRAKVEEKGFFVPESGKNPATVFGARLPRVVFGVATTTYPTAYGAPIQPVLDTVSSLSNLALTKERVNIYSRAKQGKLTENPDARAQELGQKKAELLTKFSLLNGVGILAVGTAAFLASINQ